MTGAVLVTGASSGIGRAITLDLAASGVSVFAAVRTPGTAPSGIGVAGRVHEVRLDVTDPSQIAEAVHSIRWHLGDRPLRGVVNNAGIAIAGPLEYVDIDEFRRQFEVNVFGQMAVTQRFLELLRRHGEGRIVFMSSLSGRIAAPYAGPYAANLSDLAIERYGPALERMSRYVDAVTAGHSMTPDKVVRAVRHALYATHPRPTYLVGREARVAVALSKVLPDRAFDVVLDRQTR